MISRGTDNAWLAHTPDLKPLDIYFSVVAQRRAYEAKPSTTTELFNVTKQFASENSDEKLENVVLVVLERARLCLQVDGAIFNNTRKGVPIDKMGQNVLKLSKIHY